MPLGELETHPYLNDGEIQGATKLILGSFPVYECTDHDNEIKQQNRAHEGTVRFFYGSVDSRLWQLYKNHIDNNIDLPPNPAIILPSLAQRKIAISDLILYCERNQFSSLDSDLVNKTYNKQGIQRLIQNGVRKILCTSKGVLKDLENQIIVHRGEPFGNIDIDAGLLFQANFINALGGNNEQIVGPIAKVFIVDNCVVTALAIPSPGSPQRQLAQFGFNGTVSSDYSNAYFSKAFTWLLGED